MFYLLKSAQHTICPKSLWILNTPNGQVNYQKLVKTSRSPSRQYRMERSLNYKPSRHKSWLNIKEKMRKRSLLIGLEELMIRDLLNNLME